MTRKLRVTRRLIRIAWRIVLPSGIIIAYRLIPRRIRRLWSRGQSTSGRALLLVLLFGGGWKALFRYAVPRARSSAMWFDPP